VSDKFHKAQVVKVEEELGLVLGWALVCKIEGEDYYDLQGDHVPEESMLKAAAGFMLNSRVAGEMHRAEAGTMVFAWPMTTDIAAAMGVTTKQTGLMIAMKPTDPEVLAKFKDGTYTGFSIGGTRVEDEEVDADA